MFKSNLFKNTCYATTALGVQGLFVYDLAKRRQREYDELKKAHPNATVSWEYQQPSDKNYFGVYGGYGYTSGGFKWVVKEPEPTTTPSMKR